MKALVANELGGGFELEDVDIAAPVGREVLIDVRTSGLCHTSRSVFIFTDFARLMDFNYYARIEDIAPRPILFIVGTKAATIFMSKAGYEREAQPKEWFEIPGATHHSLYDDEVQVGRAVAKLEEFFGRNL